jgi:hypothetical protein
VIPKPVFWATSLVLLGVALAVALVARSRGAELALLRGQAQEATVRADTVRVQCEQDRKQTDARIADADARAKKADADLEKTRKQLGDWKSASVRSGIVPWLGQHANCAGRGGDGHCSQYKLTDGTVLDTDLAERVQ